MTYYENHVKLNQVDPVFTEDNYDCKQVSQVLSQFGYDNFRPGQHDVIKRILCGDEVLVLSNFLTIFLYRKIYCSSFVNWVWKIFMLSATCLSIFYNKKKSDFSHISSCIFNG